VAKGVLAAAVPPYLYQSADNPDGGLDDPAIAQFEAGVKGDRIAFLDGYTTAFFSAGDELLVSEVQRTYARDIAASASPKGTLDCIAAFCRTSGPRRCACRRPSPRRCCRVLAEGLEGQASVEDGGDDVGDLPLELVGGVNVAEVLLALGWKSNTARLPPGRSTVAIPCAQLVRSDSHTSAP